MSILDFFYNLPTSIFGAMSTTGMLNRLKAKLSAQNFPPKEISTLTDRENEVKQKAINQSICDAVSAAIKSEEFTKAVAAHLASELQPSLKALDPSAFEAKLQLSSDKSSQQFDTQDTKLTHLSTILESNNSNTAVKITSIETTINNVMKNQETLEESMKRVEDQQTSKLDSITAELEIIKEKLSSLSSTFSDELKSAKEEVVAASTIPSPEIIKPLDITLKNLEQLSDKLKEIKEADLSSAVLAGIQATRELQSTHTVTLDELKSSSEKNLSVLNELQNENGVITTGITTTCDQTQSLHNLLSEIKSSDITADILNETKTANASHALCASILEEIKTKQSEILPAISSANSLQDSQTKALSDLKQTESEILEGIKLANETLSSQGQVLNDNKSCLANNVATSSGLENVSLSIESLKSTINGLDESLNDVKTSVASVTSATDKFDLSELQSSIQALSGSIENIKSSNESLSEKIDFTPVITNLEAHSAQLSAIKTNLDANAEKSGKVDFSPIESSIKEISNKLESQITSLSEIKSAISSREAVSPAEKSES